MKKFHHFKLKIIKEEEKIFNNRKFWCCLVSQPSLIFSLMLWSNNIEYEKHNKKTEINFTQPNIRNWLRDRFSPSRTVWMLSLLRSLSSVLSRGNDKVTKYQSQLKVTSEKVEKYFHAFPLLKIVRIEGNLVMENVLFTLDDLDGALILQTKNMFRRIFHEISLSLHKLTHLRILSHLLTIGFRKR